MIFTAKDKENILNKLFALKGEIVSGYQLEVLITSMHAPMKRFQWKWNLKDNTVNCSYIDDAENKINRYYIHVEVCEDTYTDLECIINNTEDETKDWAILIKDVIRK